MSEELKRKISENRKGIHISSIWNKGRTPWNKGKAMSEEQRKKISKSMKGKKQPKLSETRKRLFLEGKLIANFKGKHWSAKQRKKISDHMKGRIPWNKNNCWRGGLKRVMQRVRARRRCLGFNELNQYFDGASAHHIDSKNIVFIPIELHKSRWHALNKKPEKLEAMNVLAFCWILGFNPI